MGHDRHAIGLAQLIGGASMVRVRMGQENGLDSSAELDQMIDLPTQVTQFFFVPGPRIDHVQGFFADDQAVGVRRRRDRRTLDRDEGDSPANLKPVVLTRNPLGPASQQRKSGGQPDGCQLPQRVGDGRGKSNLAAMPARAGLGGGEPIESDDLAFDQLLLLVAAQMVQEISGGETDGHERRREPLSRRLEIIGVDRKRVLREEVGKIQLFLDEAAPRLLHDSRAGSVPRTASSPVSSKTSRTTAWSARA